MRTVGEALAWARAEFRGRVETPGLDAAVILAAVLGCDRLDLYREPERALTADELIRFERQVAARRAGQPVAYLAGHREFMGQDFDVAPGVLVPRPETELLVEEGLRVLAKIREPIVVDVGTGTGAVAVSLALMVPAARVLATDLSETALSLARKNAARHGVTVQFFQGDLLTPLPAAFTGKVDLVVANLPYIPTPELANLPREVRSEPRLALDGGPDGLDPYRRLVPQALSLLRSGGHLLFEIAPGQGRAALDLVGAPAWQSRLLSDLAGRERVIAAQKTG
ncbi:MAG: peptide chain release factor N(5)-glutamine methyltransferase [Candidatus Desulforudis sp.]|nr:peptide chain release factor N(5)-glutamine methyltransferase [Desulforudis sp.]